jgi:hypothetical protein
MSEQKPRPRALVMEDSHDNTVHIETVGDIDGILMARSLRNQIELVMDRGETRDEKAQRIEAATRFIKAIERTNLNHEDMSAVVAAVRDLCTDERPKWKNARVFLSEMATKVAGTAAAKLISTFLGLS